MIDLGEKLEETCKIAHEQLEKKAQRKQRKYYKRETRARQLRVGDKVLILLPTKANKLLMQWKEYKIVQKLGHMNYIVQIEGKRKILHINLLKKKVC